MRDRWGVMSSSIEKLPASPVVPAAPRAASEGLGRSAPPSTSFGEVLGALGRRVDTGEAVVKRALHSDMGALDAKALIAVQAGIYHYTEAVELVGKLVDRATNAVRTVLQPGGH